MKRTSALTLLELLLVIVVLGLLIAVLTPSLGGRRRPAIRSTCAANLKAIGVGAFMYTADWNGKLPSGRGAPCNWLCDLPIAAADPLCESVMAANSSLTPVVAQKIFYCPGNTAQSAGTLWTYGGIRVIGYVWLGQRDPPSSLPDLSTLPRTGPPLRYFSQISEVRNASAAILAADWIISPDTSAARFVDVQRPGTTDSFTTSHRDGAAPAGANILCLDGHVEWRTWGGTAKAAAIPCAGAGFWIPAP